MKYFLIAGEASGDIHAGQLIKSLRERDHDAEFRFFGGNLMASAAGVQPIVHYRDMAYMGFVEVIKHLGTILGFLKTAKRCIDEYKPDAVVLVDYPSFNLKVAKYAHRHGVLVFYFISPKVWAWKEYRVRQIKRYVTELYSILPFEVDFYEKRHHYKVEYVGNPTVKEISEAQKTFRDAAQFRSDNGLPADGDIVAVLPGSRLKEIADNLPTMVRGGERFDNCHLVIAGAPNVDEELYRKVLADGGCRRVDYPIVFGQTFELVYHSRVALVTSGTATLEAAVIGTPQVVCYRMNGSKLLYNIYKHMLKVKYVSLPNLIVDAPIVEELLLHNCDEGTVCLNMERLLNDSCHRKAVLAGYAEMRQRLGASDCTDEAAKRIVGKLCAKCDTNGEKTNSNLEN